MKKIIRKCPHCSEYPKIENDPVYFEIRCDNWIRPIDDCYYNISRARLVGQLDSKNSKIIQAINWWNLENE